MDDKVAPALSEVIFKKAHEIYTNPELFIDITHITETIKKIVNEVLDAFATKAGKVIMLPSTFGGGKTHIMILLYHLAKNPHLLTKILGEEARSRQHILENVEVIVIDGFDSRTAPSPMEVLEENELKIRTLWGYLAYKLGEYNKVKNYDEKLLSPEKATLLEIFTDKKVLLLIDEIGIYYNRFHKSTLSEFINYAKQVVIFLRMLSEVVKEKNVVVVLSIPAEPGESGLEAEVGYEDFINQIEREVGRVALITGKPIATDEDFANILKKRLFSKIDPRGVQITKSKMRHLHVENPELIKDISGEVEKYYPFHPLFVLTLREIVEKNKDLQKTRDALKIARKVLRNLYEKEKSSDLLLIMPSDIDLRVEEVRVHIITQKFMGFDLVLNKIINKVKEIPVEEEIKPEVYRDVAYRLALYAFLRTYIYDPHLEPRSEFPGKLEIVTGIYDPNRYEQYLIGPGKISDLLGKLTSGSIEYRIPHLYSGGGYYWVTRLLDIGERVEKEAEKVDDLTAKRLILEEIGSLYKKPYEGREEAKPTVFSENPVISLELKPLEEDNPQYKLYIIAQPLENIRKGCYKHGDIYEAIYYRLSGSQKTLRRYVNALALLIPSSSEKLNHIIKIAKKIVACDKLQKSISEEYSKDEKVAKLLKEELKKIRGDLEKNLKYKLVATYFDFIVYPAIKGGVRVVCVEQISNRAQKTIIELAEEALKEANKIIDKKYLNFDLLTSILEPVTGEEIKWTREIKVIDLINVFYESPAYPMIPPTDIKRALLSGLENLKIGVVRNGKIYFKEIENEPKSKITELRDTDIIIPPEKAAEEQIRELSNIVEEVEGDTIITRYYVAKFGDREIPIKDLRDVFPSEYIKVFINSNIIFREEKRQQGFLIYIEPSLFEFKQDEAPEKVNVKVFVKRIGSFEEEIALYPEIGEIIPEHGIPDFEATWTIPVPKKPGEYNYALHARSEKLLRKAVFRLLVKRALLCKPEPAERVLKITIESDIDATTLIKFLEVVNTSILGSKIINKCNLTIEFYEEKAKELEKSIRVSLENVTISDVSAVVRALLNAFGVTAKILCLSGFELEIRGDGKIVDTNSLSKIHEIIKQKSVHVSYCW